MKRTQNGKFATPIKGMNTTKGTNFTKFKSTYSKLNNKTLRKNSNKQE